MRSLVLYNTIFLKLYSNIKPNYKIKYFNQYIYVYVSGDDTVSVDNYFMNTFQF